jgi:DNA-binding GntR family transcriptional regulator
VDKKVSQGERVYKHVRGDLLAGRIPPGGKLNIAELAQSLALSQGGIREALARLTSEGLVISDPNRGFRAVPLSLREFDDLSRARAEFDGLCLRLAIAKDDMEWEASMVAACHRVLRRLEKFSGTDEDRSALAAAQRKFQLTLVAGCDNSALLWLRGLLYARAERYRHLALSLPYGNQKLYDRDGPFIQAIMARDADRAVTLLAAQYELTSQLIREHLKNLPDGT